jgi:hypothetical protein
MIMAGLGKSGQRGVVAMISAVGDGASVGVSVVAVGCSIISAVGVGSSVAGTAVAGTAVASSVVGPASLVPFSEPAGFHAARMTAMKSKSRVKKRDRFMVLLRFKVEFVNEGLVRAYQD